MERKQHLQWAKDRAGEYLAIGDVLNAWGSFCADMMKHAELRSHDGLRLGTMLHLGGGLSTVREVREFIEGFN